VRVTRGTSKQTETDFIYILLLLLLLLTATGLMSGGSVTKIGRTYKKMDIHSKETKHTSHDKAAHTSHDKATHTSHEKTSHKISQYSTSATNRIQGTINRIQDTKHRKTNKIPKNNKTQKQGKSYCRELKPGRQACSSSLPYELFDPVSNSGIPKLRDRAQWSASCPGPLCLSDTNTVNKNNHQEYKQLKLILCNIVAYFLKAITMKPTETAVTE
jgi:hypothetical protein